MTLHSHTSSLQLAFEDLKTQVLRNRDDINAYITLGTILRWQGKLKRAFELHYNLLVHPKLKGEVIYRLNLELGYDLLELRKKDYGLGYFDKATRSKIHRTMALEGIALVHAALGKPEKAIVQLEELSKLKNTRLPASEGIFVAAAKNLRIRGETDKARKLLEKLLTGESKSGAVILELVHVYLQDELLEKVPPLVRQGLQDFPMYSGALLSTLEDVFYTKGVYSEFEDALRKLLFDFPHNTEILWFMAKHLMKKKKIKEAITYVERGLDLEPHHVNLFKLYVELNAPAEKNSSIQTKLNVFLQGLRSA